MPGVSLNQRSYVLIGAALALPIVVLAVIQLVFAFSRERENVEQRALAEAREIVRLADARLEADLSVMAAMATEEAFERRAWPAAFSRARELAALNPHWRNVIVSDLTTNREVFSLRRPYDSAPRLLDPAVTPDAARIAGVAREGPGCPCVYLHRPIGADGRYLLSVALDAGVFEALLERHAPMGSGVDLVDRNGVFVASTARPGKAGETAPVVLRAPVAGGEASGVYAREGREQTHTAYATSALSRWSAQVAISPALVERPRTLSLLTVVVGVVLALILAIALIAWALRDLIERRRAEARLAQTQKLEAIGQLTGGVAHDFNNLLTVVIGGLVMLLRKLDDPRQRNIAEQMLGAARRGERLTKQLLAFSRGQQVELTTVDLHQLVPGMEELLRRSIGPGTELVFDLDADARWVRSDVNQLELAILNLVINARDAMPEGGRIVIAAYPGQRRENVLLSVSDTGVGMPKEVAERALEPFFTTKPAGKGTGLGLAQVLGAVRQCGGSVEIDSTPGEGTTVRLLLPRTEPAPPQPDAAPRAAGTANGSSPGKRILVVDDEPGVRTFMAAALRDAGHEAFEAGDPGAALRLLASDPPDLLLTDYSMPGMTGLELAQHARAKNERLRVLIVSGYADADMLGASAVRPALLRKPFDEDALLEAVRGALTSNEAVPPACEHS